VKSGFGHHGKRNAENQLVPTSKYAGVTCEKRGGLLWWVARRVDPSTGLSVVGAGKTERFATEELAAQAVSIDRLPPGAPAPLTGHHLLRSAINNECMTSVPFNAMEANRLHAREFHAEEMENAWFVLPTKDAGDPALHDGMILTDIGDQLPDGYARNAEHSYAKRE
jgi:hypothetical protein